MDFKTTSNNPASLQSVATPKEFLVLSVLNDKHKLQLKQQREQEMHLQQQQYEYHGQQQHKQHRLEEGEWEGMQKQSQRYMELSQIDLIYRAEGNANLVLALPQLKKVLRLPKVSKQKAQHQEIQLYQKNSQQHQQLQGQQKQQVEINEQEPNKYLTTGQQENESNAVGILTIDHYVAYISIIRCLVGNEFVFEADIVSVPNPTDRNWINEHIKPYRPANRLDKEFSGHFGLLLPDATQLPAEFDILFSNLKSKSKSTTLTTVTETSHCIHSSSSSSSSSNDNSCSMGNNIFGSDTFAIEIKPKQGWLLPNDVNNLFDIKPKATQTSSLSKTKKLLKAAVAATIPRATEAKPLKASTDIECFTTTQNEPSQTIIIPTTATSTAATEADSRSTATPQKNTSMTSSCLKTPRYDNISHSLYDKVDVRCRYCCMQFLKMKQQKICERNQYCPVDLFSGMPEKMILALQALFKCPQNNLRIFRNGIVVFDDQISKTSKIDDIFPSDKLQLIKYLLITCLLREYDNKEEVKNEEKEQNSKETKQQLLSSAATTSDDEAAVGGSGNRSGGSAGVAAGQPQSSVTSCKKQKLRTMPKPITTTTATTLTETEATKVKSTLTPTESIISNVTTSTSSYGYNPRCLEQLNKAEVTCLPKNCVLQKILNLQSLAKINLQFMLDHEYAEKKEKTYNILHKLLEKFAKTDNHLTLFQLSPEEQYTLAATALDCSIMITFCEIENVRKDQKGKVKISFTDNPFVVSTFGKTFLTKVTLLDLDPKSDAHFHKYVQQTKQILDATKEFYSINN